MSQSKFLWLCRAPKTALAMVTILLLPQALTSQTQIDTNTQAKNVPVYNVKSFGALGDSMTDDTAAIKAALAAVSAKGGGYLFFPYGSYEISSQINIPTGVQVVGLGWSNPPEFGTFGTTIQANSHFPGTAAFPQNMMLAIDGATDTYGAGASNLTLDCNSVPGCGGLYRGHANEQTYFKRINVENYSSYGLYICGAGENSDAPHVCGGNSNSGAEADGPDEDLQFYPNTAATAATLSVVIRNDLGYRGMHNITINSLPGYQPTYGGWFSGATYAIRQVHMEGPANGFYLGPTVGTLCPKNCNGLSNADFSQIDLTRGGTNAIIFNSVQNLNLHNINGVVVDNQFGQSISSVASYLGFLSVGDSGDVISNDPNFGSTLSGPGTFGASLSVNSTTTPQFTIQNKTGPTYPYITQSVGTDGTFLIGGQGGTGNWLFTIPQAIFSIGSAAPLAGLNLQSPLVSGTGSMRGVVCSNAGWSTANQNWTINNNGGTDYACSYFPAGGGFAISTSNSVTEPGTLTQTQFLANTKLSLTGAGNLILGAGAATATDSGQALQVKGAVQIATTTAPPTCTAALRGSFWFLAAASATAQDHVQVCAQNASGALGWQQIY